MDKQKLIMEIFDRTNKKLLKDKINVIESILKTDVASYYGYIEEGLASHFIRLIFDLKSKSNNDILTIILHSQGGDNESMEMIYDVIFKNYKSLNVIITDQVVSTGTIFTFMADKILINPNKSSLSMIDPQVPTSNGIYCSFFFELKANRYSFEFIDTEDIDKSLIINEPELIIPEDHVYRISYLAAKEGLLKSRKMCFDILIKHQFKNSPNKELKAVKLINYLMNPSNHLYHDFKIFPLELEDFKLNFNYYTDNEVLKSAITDYDNSMRYMIGKSENNFYETSGYGNYINCIVQSKHATIL